MKMEMEKEEEEEQAKRNGGEPKEREKKFIWFMAYKCAIFSLLTVRRSNGFEGCTFNFIEHCSSQQAGRRRKRRGCPVLAFWHTLAHTEHG